ncbi:3-isopropylmalate dehydratase small subunit [Ferrimonas senticii]|uniref:3-isopropylmalate dehydratase small subunit n=1 Tax=Ferrimonas senticii TaxID=394566 RepID=UPI000415D6C6|nr:3-isopropylmalate dehydratase small subunit [Ferrimonas senticii]
MNPFTTHTGIAAPLLNANIDTDQLIPKQFLAKISRDGFGVHLFHDWRYLDEAGTLPNPDFILNQAPFDSASILLAGENFGCGSSREHAPWALADFGIRVVIAPSFADIFRQNALNNGLLPVSLPLAQIAQLADCGEVVTVDLQQCQVRAGTHCFRFSIEAAARDNLLSGLDPIGLTMTQAAAISAFEQQQPSWR